MTCRHQNGDPNCTSGKAPSAILERARKDIAKYGGTDTPDAKQFQIIQHRVEGPMLILRVRYPSCSNCSYEGVKVMVFAATIDEALYWTEIDPHFRDPQAARDPHQAPSPVARFPASDQGWSDALAHALSKKG